MTPIQGEGPMVIGYCYWWNRTKVATLYRYGDWRYLAIQGRIKSASEMLKSLYLVNQWRHRRKTILVKNDLSRPLVTSILNWAKNDGNKFVMIFDNLSYAVFRFHLLCSVDEIDGGVQPPSRWWKIESPSRARASSISIWFMVALETLIMRPVGWTILKYK